MQRFSAYLGVVAMLAALVTAPLFHTHDHDDHGAAVTLVHAHLLEDHHAESHSEDEIESPHGHHDARWIDFFTFQAPSTSFALDIDFPEEWVAPILEQRAGITLPSDPRAHGPPGRLRSTPRSPPSI